MLTGVMIMVHLVSIQTLFYPYLLTAMTVNDICIHPNQGELISCDQAGSIKQWDLTENICTLELVCI